MITALKGNGWLSVGQLSKKYCVSQFSIREWADKGHITTARTLGGHRRLDEQSYRKFVGLDVADSGKPRICIMCRVSSAGQAKPRVEGGQSDLERQEELCLNYVKDRWGDDCVIEKNSRVSSGLNFNSPELIDFTMKLVDGQYDYVVISYKDRLARSSFSLFENLAKRTNTEIIVVEQQDDPTFTESLVDDIVALVSVASAKHNGNKFGKSVRMEVSDDDLIKIYKAYKSGLSYLSLETYCHENNIKDLKGRYLKRCALQKLLGNSKVLDTLDIGDVEDSFEVFYEAQVVADGDGMIIRTTLEKVYTKWCADNGKIRLSKPRLNATLKRLGVDKFRGTAHHGQLVYRGLALV